MWHKVRFPRYDEDIRTQWRTLFHTPAGTWSTGDTLLLCAALNLPAWARATITEVDHVRLLRDLSADDLRLLNRDDAASYFASWDAIHPGMPVSSNPLVCRIEFRYDRPERDDPSPEWHTAA